MMKDYYEKSMRALKLAGMNERTQQCYTRSVRQIVDFYKKTPDLITEVELEDYFLHRQNEDQWSAATMRIDYCGIRLFFQNVLKREWHVFTALFAASSQTLKALTPDPKYIGGDLPGFLGVLHTWGRQLQYHPHIHYIVPGGAILKEDGSWHPSRIDFYLPVRAMSKIFRAKFCEEMKKAGLLPQIPASVITSESSWNQPME